MPTLVKTLTETLGEEEAVGDTWGDALALLNNVADTLAKVKAVTQGDARVDAHALVNTLTDLVAEVDAKTLGDTRDDAHALVDTC